jgi:preprotein translocase subunit SecG
MMELLVVVVVELLLVVEVVVLLLLSQGGQRSSSSLSSLGKFSNFSQLLPRPTITVILFLHLLCTGCWITVKLHTICWCTASRIRYDSLTIKLLEACGVAVVTHVARCTLFTAGTITTTSL